MPPRGDRRGRVTHFSKRSRSRLFKLCCKTKRAAMMRAIFVTLTYPSTWSSAASSWKRDLDSWWKRVVRKYPGAAAIWRLEFQERGAPHYHLILLNVPFLPHQQTARWWAEVVGDPTGKLRAAGTETRRVRAYRQVVAYASKYVAKEASWCPMDGVGRYWGVLGRDHLPMEVAIVPLDAPTWFALLDQAAALLPGGDDKERGPPVAGLWLICEERSAWLMLGQAQLLAGATRESAARRSDP